jgi:hypothetical protein
VLFGGRFVEICAMGSVKAWVSNANGWRRLWLVGAGLALLYAIFVNPFVLTSDARLSKYQYRWAVEREFEHPECKPFLERPLAMLTEPAFTDTEGKEGCYHIYNYRKYNNPDKVPYTLQDLGSDFRRGIWTDLLGISGIGAVLVAVVSGLVYLAGLVIAWVRAGFRK